MTYNATVKLCYINDTEVSHNKYFPEIVDKQTITIEAPAQDLNTHQYFELFKGFLRAVGFDDYGIMDGACRVAFNDCNREDDMKKLANEYELFLAEDYHKKLVEYDEQQDRDIAGLEREIKELKEKLARVLPEQYDSGVMSLRGDYPRDNGSEWDAPSPYKSWNGLVPGSDEAYAEGCKCPILDNQNMPDHKKWVNGDCPLHGKVK
jgi:hypothetical protein